MREASGDTRLPSGLAAALHPGQIRRARATDSVDGVQPSLAITVRKEEDVVRIVSESRREKLAIIPVGGATDLHVGNLANAFDVRLAMTGMASVLEYSPEDMTVTAEAGVSLSRLGHILAERGQRIAVDHPVPERATVGGIVATDTTAGYCYGFGSPRDLVLGMTLVDGRARLLHAGGKVVKNVAGYDLARLFTGSHGTLGIIASVTLRTHPLPAQSRRLRLILPSANAVDEARAAIFSSHLPLACFDFARAVDEPTWRLEPCIEGTSREVDYQHGRVEQLAKCSAGEHDGPSAVGGERDAPLIVRVLSTPSRCIATAEAIIVALRAKGTERATLAGRAGDGLLRVCAHESDVRRALGAVRAITETARAHAARFVIERAPAEIKRILDVWGDRPGGFALMRAVKSKFDPDGVFSPGRYVGGI
jgi:glycolate oxidase FAD binding subunit